MPSKPTKLHPINPKKINNMQKCPESMKLHSMNPKKTDNTMK